MGDKQVRVHPFAVQGSLRNDSYVFGLRTFLAFTDFKGYFLTFEKCTTAFSVDSTEMYEYVRTAIIFLNETITFFFVEPFNCAVN